jgi:glycosyltransferase involved in cell wall biosynthesis
MVQRINPSLLHLHGYKAAVLAGLGTFLTGVPTIATAHSESISAPDMKRAIFAEAVFYRRFRKVIAVSAGVESDLKRRGIRSDRIQIIHNGVTDRFVDGSSQGDPKSVLVVGRLVREKQVHVAIGAIAILRGRGIRISLRVAGDGPAKTELLELARSSGVEDSVQLLGFREDVTAELMHSPMFLMPSLSEGIPLALLEAMAFQRAIVASRVGGIPEVVHHGEHALLVTSGDATELADSIQRLLDDDHLRQTLAAAARHRFKSHFDADHMIDRYVELYRTLL